MRADAIEDDYLIARDLQDMLDDLGFTKFSFARSEDTAIVGANKENIDLITADVRLLPGDGVNAVEAICAKRDLPVLFITAYREELEERKPGSVVLQKPVKEEDLAAAVRWQWKASETKAAKVNFHPLQTLGRTVIHGRWE